MRTVDQTAALLLLLFNRSEKKRARVSEKTIRILAQRNALRDAFLQRLASAVDDLGLHLIPLERGGFGLIPISALDGAPPILSKQFITKELRELKRLERAGNGDEVKWFARLLRDLIGSDGDEDDDE